MLSGAGFGTPPKTGFPGEVSGTTAAGEVLATDRAGDRWRYGHGISVNLVQLARAYTIFATDGELKPVTLFKAAARWRGRPVLTPATARAVRHMLEMAVSAGGTAPEAQIAGLSRRRQDRHRAQARGRALRQPSTCRRSWAFAPASNPRLLVAVMIDEPAAGPVLRRQRRRPVLHAT